MPKGSGRRPLPTAVKKLRGNPGKRALNEKEPVVASGRPTAPKGLKGIALAEWKAIVPELERMKVLSCVDGKALAAYCFSYAEWWEAHDEVERLGLVVEEPIVVGQGNDKEVVGYKYKRNPAVSIMHEAMKIMKAFLIEFGLTPAARSRLRVETKAPEADPMDAFLSRGAVPKGTHVN
jgi:P27 family predicted phage terminase small subunit